MEKSVVFVSFNPESWYELRSFGTTLDALGGWFYLNNRGEVNYNGIGLRRNGLTALLKWREVHCPLAELWERKGRIKTCIVPSNCANVQIDKRSLRR